MAVDKVENCFEKVRHESKMKPRLRAESVGVTEGTEREGLEILDIC